ncbi:hypothetical protein Q1695_006235 [Nippostrongylus brasiliensis]|nr:hypothetical protein Q1695_006235 [Nippostrongylus brasiliensis]
MDVEMKSAPLKRPLSFSDDSFEWDSAKNVGWDSSRGEYDGGAIAYENGLPIEWAPFGRRTSRKAKKPRLEVNTTPQKKPSTDTIDKLDDSDKEIATQIIQSITKYPGSFVFESADRDTYSRLVPFPSQISTPKMDAKDDWELDKQDCCLESLLSRAPAKPSRTVTFPVWKAPKRRERKYEAVHVKREVKAEDLLLEEGDFSWNTFANLIKPQFAAVDPKTRCDVAKRFHEFLQSDLSSTSATEMSS